MHNEEKGCKSSLVIIVMLLVLVPVGLNRLSAVAPEAHAHPRILLLQMTVMKKIAITMIMTTAAIMKKRKRRRKVVTLNLRSPLQQVSPSHNI